MLTCGQHYIIWQLHFCKLKRKFMSVPVVKFNKLDRPEFFRVLHGRVNKYFQDKDLSKHANSSMVVKTVFMLCLYAIPLVLMITGVVTTFWFMMLMWFIMGFGMSGIGLSVMHDANHGSYSSNVYVNRGLGYVLNLIGGYHINWKIQHNVLHHSFTNVHGFDEDIEKGVMRFSPDQERKPIFRYQVYYAPILYGLLTIFWLVAKDFIQLFRYNKKELLEGQNQTFREALTYIIINKTWYIAITLILPILVLDLPWWQVLLGFLMMQFISGLILALIFQPAHVLEETNFFKPDENGSVENNWAIHQMHTTANFANDSVVFSWFIGGLNHQIEHHLFPNICHVHYKELSHIVKATAEEYEVPYYQHKTFFGALKSHFTLLNKLGTGKYDLELAKAS
ncbi:MAG: acyl-CoA desaturase [Saprospiraceae bacterium]|nr:acyl-CoA desaturase [Saprospiraceae bacterium]